MYHSVIFITDFNVITVQKRNIAYLIGSKDVVNVIYLGLFLLIATKIYRNTKKLTECQAAETASNSYTTPQLVGVCSVTDSSVLVSP